MALAIYEATKLFRELLNRYQHGELEGLRDYGGVYDALGAATEAEIARGRITRITT